MRPSPRVAGAAFAVVFVALLTGAALADESSIINNTLNCSAGIGGAFGSHLQNVFSFSNGPLPAVIGIASTYYTGLCFMITIVLLITRLTMMSAREQIDGFVATLFDRGIGPCIVFAMFFFVADQVAAGTQHWVVGEFVNNAASTGVSVGAGFEQQNNYLAGTGTTIADNLKIDQALNAGNVSGIVTSGICSSYAVVLGADISDTGNNMLLAVVETIVSSVASIIGSIFGSGGSPTQTFGTLLFVLICFILKIFIAIAGMIACIKLAFEAFKIYIVKTLILPIGLIFAAFGQLEFLRFLREAYVRLIFSTLARCLVFAVVVPLFFGVYLATIIITTQEAQPIASIFQSPMTTLVPDVLMEATGVAFLFFALGQYDNMAQSLIDGGSHANPDALFQAMTQAAAPAVNAAKAGIAYATHGSGVVGAAMSAVSKIAHQGSPSGPGSTPANGGQPVAPPAVPVVASQASAAAPPVAPPSFK